MELEQLKCFVAVAEELHFGRAAQKMGLLPASLGRHVRLLEESLGTRLMSRTTRSVSLTEDGAALLEEVRPLLHRLQALAEEFRSRKNQQATVLRIGAIDSAAAGLIPPLLHDFREQCPGIVTQLVEDKSIRLIPKLIAGRLDIVFIRPREGLSRNLSVRTLVHETPVIALAVTHPLAASNRVSVKELGDEPLIVPERRSRPHSYDLTMKLFQDVGLHPRIAQIADEKQTIINLVAAGIGSAIVPRWTAKLAVSGVTFVPLASADVSSLRKLPLAVAWPKAVRDAGRDQLLELLDKNIGRYAEQA
ncbi:LysR family transcriptional regulator [Agrobacterium tumefaciens]|uniref:LysR family transcriptional regulator n=1 Tax=Agrobacterium TaxID=357 RepID=UPI00129766F4|nr:LysR family transcriptional regulator [Agrobacterium sp. ICMP 6402]MQB12243.1 LysR family transcriptional regulator [Agrobacterium sp. ICMP 6402]NTA61837.1 LysR family transcriptional regulator [Agrobacterium tumefaciens]